MDNSNNMFGLGSNDPNERFSVEIKTTDGYYFAFGDRNCLLENPRPYKYANHPNSKDLEYAQLIDEVYEHFLKQNVKDKLDVL